MYGDFARVTFDALKSRSRVLMQQGRVQLESDWNEQGAIFLHLLRTLTRDLIGPAGGPEHNCGFGIATREWLHSLPESDKRRAWLKQLTEPEDFLIGAGHYYIDGFLCDNPELVRYHGQAATIGTAPETLKLTNDALYLAYLDVVEHSVFSAEDESLLEVAIGIETAIRARQTWVVRTVQLKSGKAFDDMEPSWAELVDGWQSASRGWLKCRAGEGADGSSSSACIVAPQSRFRGPENQLYRVEVHKGGVVEPAAKKPKGRGKGTEPLPNSDRPTFKFSRINGSAVYRIEKFEGTVVTLADLGRDDRFNLDEGDWVEILDDSTILPANPGPLRKVVGVDTYTRRVTLEAAPGIVTKIGEDPDKHPYMRRWDQRDWVRNERQGEAATRPELNGGVAAIELDEWIALEDGVEILFQAPDDATGPVVFRSGDYWLAPARVATGGIIDWPQVDGKPKAIPPHGVEHHFGPLAILKVVKGELSLFSQCRRSFEVPTKLVQKVI